mgnify:CR=1 FL=1
MSPEEIRQAIIEILEDIAPDEDLSKLNDAGIMNICAAGNQGLNIDSSPTYPGGYHFDNTITVGCLSNDNTSLAGLSNYGVNSVDLAAPGTMIKTGSIPNSLIE